MRLDYPELYRHIKSLSSKLSDHQFKMTLIYFLTYLEEFKTACKTFLDLHFRRDSLDLASFQTQQKFEDVNPEHKIYRMNSIFFNKVGKYPETDHIFSQVGLKLDEESNGLPTYFVGKKTHVNMDETDKVINMFQKYVQVKSVD